MIVKEYITSKFQSFGIQLSDAELFEMCLSGDFKGDDELTVAEYRKVSVAIVKFIPSLLLRPTSINESGFSISRTQRADIESFYNLQCAELKIPNQLKPKVSFVRL